MQLNCDRNPTVTLSYTYYSISQHTWFVDQPTVKNIDASPIKSASEKCCGGGYVVLSFFLSFISWVCLYPYISIRLCSCLIIKIPKKKLIIKTFSDESNHKDCSREYYLIDRDNTLLYIGSETKFQHPQLKIEPPVRKKRKNLHALTNPYFCLFSTFIFYF